MMRKAIFLDRDGTINIEKHYLYKKEEFEFLPKVFESLKLLQQAGFQLIIITNQSGIGRGYYTEADFWGLTDWMLNEFLLQDIRIARIYYCPHLPDAANVQYRKTCNCRKPGVDLFMEAVRDFDIDLSLSYAVGDRLRDCSICAKTACHGYLIGCTEESAKIEQVKRGEYAHIAYRDNLYEAAIDILKRQCE